MRSRILLGTLFGALGGFLGFALQERMVSHNPDLPPTLPDLLLLGAVVGAMLGVGIGAVEGAVLGSPRLVLRGTVLGAVVGALGGMFGAYFGSVVFGIALAGRTLQEVQAASGPLDFTQLVIARALGWTFLGAFPGLAAGAATLSRRRALHGLAGGLVGGFIGGALFDPLGTVVAPLIAPAAALAKTMEYDGGGPSRALGLTCIGLFTGLFVGLVEELLKQAWVRVLAGKNEGKDYIVSKPLTVLGRDERADIPLYGDPSLAPQHAAIRMDNGRHMLLDGGTSIGSVVNGQRVQEQLLRDGDMIQLGQMRLLFREKATAARVGRPAVDAPAAAQAPGALAMPSHLCPFCGAQKDAAGNCLCSVPGAAPADAAAVPAYAAQPPAGHSAPMGYTGGPPMTLVGSRLAALDGPYAGQSFPLVGDVISIGREPGRDIALMNDSTVSRRHAHVAEEAGQHVLYDEGSSNGTFVNNARITVQTLAPGDVVQFGASKFRYEA